MRKRKRTFFDGVRGASLPASVLLFTAFLTAMPERAHATPPELRGSLEARASENRLVAQHDLRRYRNLADLRAAIVRGELVPVRDVGPFRLIRKDIGEKDRPNADAYRTARPWVQHFLTMLACDPTLPKGATFGITSLVRTHDYQARLRGKYRNAARGRTAEELSSHLTGATVDITTKGMDPKVKRWLARKLVALERAGVILATEEKRSSACFHIMVAPPRN